MQIRLEGGDLVGLIGQPVVQTVPDNVPANYRKEKVAVHINHRFCVIKLMNKPK